MLDTVIDSFHNGATAKDIALRYPSLELAAVYEVIAYYLRHRAKLDAYLERSKVESAALQAVTEAKYDPTGVRALLLGKCAVLSTAGSNTDLVAEQRERRGWDELDLKLLRG